MNKNNFINIKKHPEFWEECVSIYKESFPKMQREDTKIIYKKIQNGSYRMIAFVDKNIVKGFYIVVTFKKFALVSYLAVKDSCRGYGIGSKLCKHAIKLFSKTKKMKWLLIEAELRQSLLYEKLGFTKLKLDYIFPAFKDKKGIKMNLLAIVKHKRLSRKIVKNMLVQIFTKIYRVKKSDKRTKTQLKKVPKKIQFAKV